MMSRTSSMTKSGTVSTYFASRSLKSKQRIWSQRTTPVVCSPAPIKLAEKPLSRAKTPPFEIGATMGTPVIVLYWRLVKTSTGRSPCCSRPSAGSRATFTMSPLPNAFLLITHGLLRELSPIFCLQQLLPAFYTQEHFGTLSNARSEKASFFWASFQPYFASTEAQPHHRQRNVGFRGKPAEWRSLSIRQACAKSLC